MSINALVMGLMIAYFICAYFVAYKFTVLVFKGGSGDYYGFKNSKVVDTYMTRGPL